MEISTANRNTNLNMLDDTAFLDYFNISYSITNEYINVNEETSNTNFLFAIYLHFVHQDEHIPENKNTGLKLRFSPLQYNISCSQISKNQSLARNLISNLRINNH